ERRDDRARIPTISVAPRQTSIGHGAARGMYPPMSDTTWRARLGLGGIGLGKRAKRKPAEAAFEESYEEGEQQHPTADDGQDGWLTASGVRKSYRRRLVVRGVDLAVRRGEAVGLLGPNGAGKTTVFYMI